MTKKPRKFFSRKKVEVSSQKGENKNQLSESILVKASQKKKNKILKELIIFAFIFFFFILGVIFYSKNIF